VLLKIRTLVHSWYHTAIIPMGRPAASEVNKNLAVEMALIVTRISISSNDMIARSGKCSVYALFKTLCPGIVRESNFGPRDGISEVEFNKALQVCILLQQRQLFWFKTTIQFYLNRGTGCSAAVEENRMRFVTILTYLEFDLLGKLIWTYLSCYRARVLSLRQRARGNAPSRPLNSIALDFA
jgi:hypothetical protein